MLIKNKTASLGIISVTYKIDGQLKELIKGNITFNDFWNDFRPLAKQIAKLGFDNGDLKFPKVYNYKEHIQITVEQPYTQNSMFGTVHGGTVILGEGKMIMPNKKKYDLKTKELTNGVIMETPLHMVINSQVQREYAMMRKEINYPTLDAVGKSRADSEMAELEQYVTDMSVMPPASYLFPEHIMLMNGNDILISNAISTPWLNGLSVVNSLTLAEDNSLSLDDFFTSAVDAYKGVFGDAKSISDIKIELDDIGIIVEKPSKWIKIPDTPYHVGNMSQSLREYLTNNASQVLALFPYFLRNTYHSMELNGSELGTTLYDFSRVLSKLFDVQVKDYAANMLADKYELLANIRASIGNAVTSDELHEFALLLALRTGDIMWELENDEMELTLKQLREVKKAIEDLKNPVVTLAEERQTLYTYKATQKMISISVDGVEINLVPRGKDWIASSGTAAKVIMNPVSNAAYEMVELFEEIQSIYFACLDPSLTKSDVYSLDQGTYKFKINSVMLSQQLHYGFTGTNPIFVIAKSKA